MERRFSGDEIVRWAQYFDQRDKEYGKLDHYMLTLIGAVAGIVGAEIDLDELKYDQPEPVYMTAAELFEVVKGGFGNG